MPLRIAIDASRTTVQRITGTEHYAIQLIRALIALNERPQHQHRITLYFRDAPSDTLFPHSGYVRYRVIPLRRVWTHLRFAAELWRTRPDVTFVPAHTLPLFSPGNTVVTIHDLGYKYFPEAHPPKELRYLDWSTRHSARRAQMIIADSSATAYDLIRHYDTSPGKIRIVHPGVEIAPVRNNTIIERVRHKYGLPARYFLFIGTLQPRKNIARIVQAYQRYRQQSQDQIGLVLGGGKGWLYNPMWTEGVDGVYTPGYIDEADKSALYAGAVALVFPSLYEGFGFPVVEAMTCGTPVIASQTSSLPELVGDAGILVDPLNVDAIAAAMHKIANDSQFYLNLQVAGYQQAEKFSWQTAAIHTMDALEAAAH